MSKENFLFLIFIILIFYLILMPIINKYYMKNNNETLENFDSLLINKTNISPNLIPPHITNLTVLPTISPIPNFIKNNYENGVDSNNNYLPINNDNNILLPDSMKMDKQRCSINCCGLNQWTPLMDPNYNSVSQGLNYDYGQWATNIPTEFVGSNFSCNNGDKGHGCVCLSKNIINTLATHGGNL